MAITKQEPVNVDGTAGDVLTPVMPGARIPTLDILRGFALFGVLWSNLNHYGTYEATFTPNPTTSATPLDHTLFWMQEWLIQNRFYSLLGFLFGVGFAIQLGRAEALGRDAVRPFYRRMSVLLVIGMVHGMFIWSGDILTKFALVGCLLPLYRRLTSRGLVIAAGATYFGLAYLAMQASAAVGPTRPPALPDFASLYADGTYWQIMPARLAEYLRDTRGLVVQFSGRSVPFLTLFILGLWAARTGLVSHLGERLRFVRRALWVALACVAAGLILAANFDAWWPRPPILNGPPVFDVAHIWNSWWFIGRGIPSMLVQWGTAGAYAAALTLLVHRPRWGALIRPLAAVGRMSLTTYLVQSVVSTLIFYGYGLGLYGRVTYSGMLFLTLVIFGCQLAYSTWWFNRYRFGPAEWLWRSLSYGRSQPMRLGTAAERASV